MFLDPHRYGSQVMEKVLKMAEGIDIGEMQTFELVPSKKLKRQRSPPDSECIGCVSWGSGPAAGWRVGCREPGNCRVAWQAGE